MYPKEFRAYETDLKKQTVHWSLAGNKTLTTKTVSTVALPVIEKGTGELKTAAETGVITRDCTRPLLAAADKEVFLKGEESYVVLEDTEGKRFNADIDVTKDVPELKTMRTSAYVAAAAAVNGGDEAMKMAEAEKAQKLLLFHIRLGHATAERLHRTLAERGLEGDYSVEDCRRVTCRTCRLANRRKMKVPRRGKSKRAAAFNDVVFQDLTELKPVGIGGARYVSVIIED